MKFELTRRSALRGILNGATVTVGVPLLDIFLDGNGEALAATGSTLPVRFGTWFWGLGCNPQRWFPDKAGADYDIKVELEAIRALKSKVNVFSKFNIPLDGRPNSPHLTGGPAIRSGTVPGVPSGPTFDVSIGDLIGTRSRFRSLELTAVGGPTNSLSSRGNGNLNPAEGSAAALYARIFGAGFRDPNSATFTPDPAVMARRSALSGVTEQRQALEARLGVSDRQRLDQYFTSLRQLEKQLDIQLTKPDPMPSCAVPGKVADAQVTSEIESVVANHRLMVDLLVMVLACDNTRVFNLAFNQPASGLTRAGSTITHHQLTHEEPADPSLGYQPKATFFIDKAMEGWSYFIKALDAVKEGDRTLLDNTIVFAHSETELARTHNVDNIPMMTAGSGGGRIKTGLHIDGAGTPASRLGLTLQQVMGVTLDRWGTGSMETSRPIKELVA